VPSAQEVTRKYLDGYLMSVDDIERVTGEKIPVANYAKHGKLSQSWLIPMDCNKSKSNRVGLSSHEFAVFIL
jgi:endonuclease G